MLARTFLGNPRKPPPFDPDLWTLGQAADFLDLPRRDLLDLIHTRQLRYVQRGIRIRIHRQELERYRDSRY